MILITPAIDWSSPLEETRSYATIIATAWDGAEQRQSRRDEPERRLSYQVSALEAREAGLLDALQRVGQGALCLVPYWRGATYLTATVAVAATSLPVITPFYGYEIGQYVMLWRSADRAEAVLISGMTGAALTVAPTTLGWHGVPQPDRVMPCYSAVLASEVGLRYPARFATVVTLTFDLIPPA